jgi:flagellar secretion chaperone FliS
MNPYFEQSILNADPVQLVRLIYQRATSCVREAREHLQYGRIAQRSEAITRAYAALEELLSALRPEIAEELSGRLQSLYLYMQQRLLDANLQQQDQPLAEVLGLLMTLAEAWAGVAHQMTAGESAGPEVTRKHDKDNSRWMQPHQGTEEPANFALNA